MPENHSQQPANKELRRIVELVAKDAETSTKIETCLREARALTEKMRDSVATHPDAVAQMLGLNLLHDSKGAILRTKDGAVYGYRQRLLWSVEDPNLGRAIQRYQVQAERDCNRAR